MMNKQQTSKAPKIQGEILRLFRSIGWNVDFIVPVASKYYETIVGRKEASVWIYPVWNDENYICRMSPIYESEGRNVLSTSSALITRGMDAQDIYNTFNEFIDRIENEISGSYAVRLLRSLSQSQ